MSEKAGERVAKVIARAGLCSRREAEALIEQGRVFVNGNKLHRAAHNVGDEDEIVVDGKKLQARERPRLFRFNKPREVLVAAQRLQSEDGLAVEVWSVTSFSELQRDGLACESPSCNTQQPASQPAPPPAPQPWITQCLATPQARTGNKATAGDTAAAPIPTIAATDYVRALPELVRAWVPGPYITLGTDGYGRSDTRAALRAHFQVDAAAVVAAARRALQFRPHPSGSAPA